MDFITACMCTGLPIGLCIRYLYRCIVCILIIGFLRCYGDV